ncbi:Asparagine synthetase 1 [Hibiscus syriacus]|uniref:Asparagine synthetase 1 n=1 Tax=Hibiscus syriacus TaxID=106335 RepID=A0A6A2YM49_HIBSY|nr:Asparagine synthetase 1 [Hibiscus syriacus]
MKNTAMGLDEPRTRPPYAASPPPLVGDVRRSSAAKDLIASLAPENSDRWRGVRGEESSAGWVCGADEFGLDIVRIEKLNDDCEHFECFPPCHLYSSKSGGFRRWYNPPWFSKAIKSVPFNPHAVTKRLMTDVPFGVLLSGGFDSSLVVSITALYLAGTKASKQWGAQLILSGSPDLKAAKEVADYVGTAHHEFHFTVQDGIDAIEDVIYHVETYDVTTIRASTPMFLMYRKIKSLGIKALHQYDCLRANKATSAWGLEARVPFLDKEFINVAMSIDPEAKMIKKDEGRIEKWVLRRAFEDEKHPYLPKHILYRQKEQFSDSVGYSWIDGLKAHAARHNSARLTVPEGASVVCRTAKAVEWDAAWKTNLDPSGLAALGVHLSAYDSETPLSNKTSKVIDSIPRMMELPGVAIQI